MANIEQGGTRGTSITPGGVLLVSTMNPLTGLSPSYATVTGTSAAILSSNPSRAGLIIRNVSSDTVSLSFGSSPAALNEGITLTPFSSFSMDEYSYSQQAINAVSSGTASQLSMQEFA